MNRFNSLKHMNINNITKPFEKIEALKLLSIIFFIYHLEP